MKYSIAAFVCVFLVSCVSMDTLDDPTIAPSAHAQMLKTQLDNAAMQWLAEEDVPSIAVAYIEDGRLQWSAVYGERAPGAPATGETLYNIASMTKPITAEVILRLASEGVISLDEVMSPNWVDPDIAENPWHELLTPEIALRHRTGFPNWRYQTGDVLTFKFEPGTKTAYSGEGYDYVARFAEKKTGTSFDELAQKYVFDPIGMSETTYIEKDWVKGRQALPKGPDGDFGEPDLGESWSAADNVHTTAEQYANFIVAVMKEKAVAPDIASQRFEFIDNVLADRCPVALENCPLAVGMGLGWQVFKYQSETVIMHGGADRGERTLGYFVPARGTGVVMFTNGANGMKVISKVSALLYDNPQFTAFLDFQAQH